jgi:beta-glucosidase
VLQLILTVVAAFAAAVFALRVLARHGRRIDISPAAYPWAERVAEQGLDAVAEGLLARMSLREKIAQLSGGSFFTLVRLGINRYLFGAFPNVYAGYNARLRIPPISFSDGPRGVVVGRGTCFPVAMARGASWDRELERRVGDAIGKEVRAAGANYFGGLCINLLRHPAWGRAQETFGEDPWLVGEMGVALMQGVQAHGVMACAKHFAVNNIENSRFYVDVEIDERPLREVYLPHFEKCVRAGVASVMSAYNRLRGEYCGQNEYLLTQILRRDWGFDGFVSSDWVWGIRETEAAIAAGMDLEMPRAKYYGRRLAEAVRSGRVPEAAVDRSVLAVLRRKLAYAARPDTLTYDRRWTACREHVELAREAAEKSFVLLKNEGATLPLDRDGIQRIAVIGKLAAVANLGDHGSSRVSPPHAVTLVEGIRSYLRGFAEVEFADGSDLARARVLAEGADAVLLVAGYEHCDEGENLFSNRKPGGEQKVGRGGDRLELGLKPEEVELIAQLAPVNAKTVVSLIGGSAILMEEWKHRVPAILMVWYPGMEGGHAWARVLFGERSPSGKLPFTIPAAASQLPPFDAFAASLRCEALHGYTLMDRSGQEPAFPFGFGLSYTRFEYAAPELSQREIPADGSLTVSVRVKNTGDQPGEEIVQLYVGFENSSVVRPRKLLRDFQKIFLEPGEEGTARLSVSARDLAWFDPEQRRWEVEAMTYSLYVGSSSRPRDLQRAEFEVG